MKVLLLLMLMLSLVACSGSKTENEMEGEETGVELADADEFSEDGEEDIVAESEEEDLGEEGEDELGDESEEEVAESDEEGEAMDQDEEMGAESFAAEGTTSQPVAMSGEEGEWTVSPGETLMIIAFKIYGDYEKWRDIARMNSDRLGGAYNISRGMKLRYNAPAEPFVFSPEGNPYLIRVGDTLGTISTTTYGTNRYWKNIWNNNRPLIKDPNKIFAGFTIYTPLLEGRGVANN